MNNNHPSSPSAENENFSSFILAPENSRSAEKKFIAQPNHKKSLYWGLIIGFSLALLILFFAPAIREASFIISSLLQKDNQIRTLNETPQNQELIKLQKSMLLKSNSSSKKKHISPECAPN